MSAQTQHRRPTQRPDVRTVRLKQGLSLEDIAKDTKINPHYLRAIESADFDALPGGVYNTSYLRQYAKAIGCDQATLVAHYLETVEMDGRNRSVPTLAAPKAETRRWWGRLARSVGIC